MTSLPLPAQRRLDRDQFLHFSVRQPLRLRAEQGTLWITVDGLRDDIALDAGQSRVFAPRDVLTVGTLGGDAEFTAEVSA